MSNLKYELIPSEVPNKFRVRALKNFADISIGDIGGYVAGPNNLSHKGDCWVYDDSRMYNNSRMYGNSSMQGNSRMYNNSSMHGNSSMLGSSRMYDDSSMHDDSIMHGNSRMHDNSRMHGNSRMLGSSRMHDNSRLYANTILRWTVSSTLLTLNSSDGHTFAYDVENNKVSAGCVYLTIPEALEHWRITRGGTELGDERIATLRALLVLHNRPVNF